MQNKNSKLLNLNMPNRTSSAVDQLHSDSIQIYHSTFDTIQRNLPSKMSFEPVHVILVPIAYAQKLPFNDQC